MTDQQQEHAIPQQAPPPAPGPWDDYLAAAQRLDAIRRHASAAVGEQQAALTAARQELASVRARLAPQQARLIRDFGVPESELSPGPTELDAAAHAMAGGPAAVLAALQQARRTADAADAAIIGPVPAGPVRPWVRNLLIYGPFAAAVLVAQIVLYLVAPQGSVPTYALLCGLTLPVLAFGLGWVTIGFVYGGGPAPVDRTPILGAATCFTPVLLTCMGVGLTALF
jgi:hypothetical protein